MKLRNGKTTHAYNSDGIKREIKRLEDGMVSAGRQTHINLNDLRVIFNKTDTQYLAMLSSFARMYKTDV